MAYPCGYCGKNCTRLCVACDQCETWFHNTCQKLTKDPNCDYICLKCNVRPMMVILTLITL